MNFDHTHTIIISLPTPPRAQVSYDVSYDTGDKSIQCGRLNDVFKLWLMWKQKVGHVTKFKHSDWSVSSSHVTESKHSDWSVEWPGHVTYYCSRVRLVLSDALTTQLNWPSTLLARSRSVRGLSLLLRYVCSYVEKSLSILKLCLPIACGTEK